MASPILHLERAALIAAKPRPLTPEEEAARTTRINNDLVNLLKRPCPTGTRASIQGIGLYTHVGAPPASASHTTLPSNPVFLPVGGPKRISKDGTVLEAPISEEVEQIWKDVRYAVKEEEKYSGRGDMTAEKLKERYRSLDVPDQTTKTPLLVRLQPRLQQLKELARVMQQNAVRNIGQQSDGRRSSLGVGLAGDVVVDGTDQAVSENTRALPTRTTTNISEYHENDDPRRRRR